MASQDDGDLAPHRTSFHTPPPAIASQSQTVRFASINQEIEPAETIPSLKTLSSERSISDGELSPEAREEILTLSKGLQDSHLQHRRMSNFGFEPVSMPASRVSRQILNSMHFTIKHMYCLVQWIKQRNFFDELDDRRYPDSHIIL